MSLLKGFHHVSMKCSSHEKFQEDVKFYRDVLGIPLLRSWGGEDPGAMLQIDGTIIEIFEKGQAGSDTGSINHFAFLVDDPAPCVEAVRKAGYEITQEPFDLTMEATDGDLPLRVAFCRGPIGEEIEFFSCKK
ncbi:MAG: VOC family protein [Anaerovoracaceae bacterium]|jgi:catechol 2,3-dioxygenase-like lactoylglutathione lyase family enzyme